MSTLESDLERGRREGRTEARLEGHEERLNSINGSITRSATAVEGLAQQVSELRNDFRLATERTEAARLALAAETERRRLAVDDAALSGDRKWSRATWTIGVLVTVILALLALHFGGVATPICPQ